MIDRCLRCSFLFLISFVLVMGPIENARASFSLVVPAIRLAAPRFQFAIAKVIQSKTLSLVTAGVDSGAIVNGPEVVVASRVAQTAALHELVTSGASVATGGALAIAGAPVWLGVLASAGVAIGAGYIASEYFDISFEKDSAPPVPSNPPAPAPIIPTISPKDNSAAGGGGGFKMPVMEGYKFPPIAYYNFPEAPLVVSSVYPEATFFDIAALPNPYVALSPDDLKKLPFSYKYYSDIGTKRFYFTDFSDLYNGVGSYLNNSLDKTPFSFPPDLKLYYSDNYSDAMGSMLGMNNLYNSGTVSGIGFPRTLDAIKRIVGNPSLKQICSGICDGGYIPRVDFAPLDVFFIPTDSSGKLRFRQFALNNTFSYPRTDNSIRSFQYPLIDDIRKVTSDYREFYTDPSGVDLFFNFYVRGRFVLYIPTSSGTSDIREVVSDTVYQLGTYLPYNKNPFFLPLGKLATTLADLWRMLNNEDALKRRVASEVIAAAADETMRKAADRPGYNGIPYDAARPITPSEVERWLPEPLWPVQRDLFAPPDITLGGAIPWEAALNPEIVEPYALDDAVPGTGTGNPEAPATDIAMTCGGWFQPACNINWGVEVPEMGGWLGELPDFLRPLLDLFFDFKSFSVPSHAAICPSGSIDLWGKTYYLNYQCVWFEEHRAELVSFFSAVFMVLGVVILLAA